MPDERAGGGPRSGESRGGPRSGESRSTVADARERILTEHRATVTGVLQCADDVAATWDGDAATGRSDVVDPLSQRLHEADLLARLPGLLSDAVAATDHPLAASPVTAPPYVVVTSRGPVLRGTTDAGRLVVVVRAFDVERGDTLRYVRGPTDPAAALSVSFE